MRRFWGSSALALALGIGGGAMAGECAAWAEGVEVAGEDDIVVTATRTAKDQFGVPATTTVITDEEIEANLATDIKDLVRFEPGVSVRSSPSRFTAALAATGRDGNSGFNIRGLEGNRVLFLVDGIRVPDGFSFGPASFGRGDYVDLDLLKRVEIVRGPASALYGSDGLAGIVSFTTKDPIDMLGDENFAARLRASYASADDSWATGVSAAGQTGDWSALVTYTRRDASEQDNQGVNPALSASRTHPNPQTIESNAALARVVFAPSDAHRFRLSYDAGDRSITTEALSARSATVLDLDGLDESERQRLGFDYRYESEGGLIDRGFAAIYSQQSELLQFSNEDRFPAVDRTRITSFDNDVWGVAGQLESSFEAGGLTHNFVYGGDYSVTRQEGVRDGTVPPVGESFPTRAFPNTDYTLAGLFIQDEIGLFDGRLSLFPALRYDSYELEPEADALYPLATAGQSDGRVTPRIGLVAWPTAQLGFFFTYAQGFKAPSPSQVNNNFSNPLIGYTSLPNPDLKPETSESYELGVRFRDLDFAGGEWRASAAAFTGAYDDFIDQVQVGGTFTPLDPAIFQYINLGEVDIWGLEGRVDANWTNGVGVNFAASFAEGDQAVGGVETPLQSIEPWKLVWGVSYDAPDAPYGGQFIVIHSAAKDSERACAGCFTPDEFTLFDVTAYLRVTDDATFRVGLFNLSDETYWWWGDVRGLSSASTTRDAFTQPGRNFSASISYRF